jgi:hypothetical protein
MQGLPEQVKGLPVSGLGAVLLSPDTLLGGAIVVITLVLHSALALRGERGPAA